MWIAVDPENSQRLSKVLQAFGGFPASKVKPSMFLQKGKVFVFGREPLRIDLLTSPSGIDFEESYTRLNVVTWDGIKVPLIAFEDLKRNKRASGRAKDLADLDNLPPKWPWKPSKPSKRRRKS